MVWEFAGPWVGTSEDRKIVLIGSQMRGGGGGGAGGGIAIRYSSPYIHFPTSP